MNKLLLFTLAFSLPLTQVVRADNNDNNRRKHRRQAEPAAEHRGPQTAAPARQTVRQPVRQNARSQSPSAMRQGRSPAERNLADFAGPNRYGGQAVNDQTRNRTPNVRNTPPDNGRVAVQRNRGGNRNSFTVARSRVIRTPHNRNWWRNRYTTFVLFGGGYYYWNGGYWYPAYGYDPYYNSYAYNEPIYGYNDLAPGQVLENVQLALRDEGYYYGAIDGLIGPQTQAALAAYQRDHGLLITSAVDEPTLVTLGLA